jgi:hypothetical protein
MPMRRQSSPSMGMSPRQVIMEAMRSNAFLSGELRSSERRIDNKLRLALGRGLATAYTDVVREPIPERLLFWLRQLEVKESRNR